MPIAPICFLAFDRTEIPGHTPRTFLGNIRRSRITVRAFLNHPSQHGFGLFSQPGARCRASAPLIIMLLDVQSTFDSKRVCQLTRDSDYGKLQLVPVWGRRTQSDSEPEPRRLRLSLRVSSPCATAAKLNLLSAKMISAPNYYQPERLGLSHESWYWYSVVVP